MSPGIICEVDSLLPLVTLKNRLDLMAVGSRGGETTPTGVMRLFVCPSDGDTSELANVRVIRILPSDLDVFIYVYSDMGKSMSMNNRFGFK